MTLAMLKLLDFGSPGPAAASPAEARHRRLRARLGGRGPGDLGGLRSGS